ncbi:MAG: YggS family pyridoxal phosphate-dependent enzyme [Fimbriimonadaceae bacterium]
MSNSSLADRYQWVLERVDSAANRAGRNPSDICLIAVSKGAEVNDIRTLYDLGHRDFGESRLQHAIPKVEQLPDDIIWHFIGPLQSNKVKKVAEHFSVVHSLCTDSQLQAFRKCDRLVQALIEVDLAGEEQKEGLTTGELPDFVRKASEIPSLQLRGLMTIGAFGAPIELTRKWFKELKQLLSGVPGATWLSMGMSDNFELAIEEGATHIRVGSAIFEP